MSTKNMTVRPANERGMADHGWLKSAHSFSFASYHDPQHMQYGALRVINDDEVAGGGGFPPHQHQDAEIFSYVLEGSLEHKDSMGNGSVVAAGGVQYMSAGSGVVHSEFNPSADARVRFLQVWLLPSERGVTPRYETMMLDETEKAGKLKLFLSPDGRDGSMVTKAQAFVSAATLSGDQRIEHALGSHEPLRPKGESKAWLQVARGSLRANGVELGAGDGVAIDGGGALILDEGDGAEVLLFEM